MTGVAIVGGTGRLGGIIQDVIAGLDGFETVASIGSSGDIADIDGADLVVDASSPAISIDVVRRAVEHRQNLLVATSGWSSERIAFIRPLVAAAGSGALFVPNFSIASVIGSMLAAAAAPYFPSIEIVEAHHAKKVDSPSGTAVRTAELIAAARSAVGPVESPHVDQRARGQQVASVPVHSLRRPGVLARQETILSGPGESLSLVHDIVDPALAYAPGIRMSLLAARDARGVVLGLDSLLDIGMPHGTTAAGPGVAEGSVPGQVARETGA